MRKSRSPSRSPLSLSTYAELERYVAAFAAGHLNLLILTGPPGVGKTRQLHSALGDNACYIEGHTTAFGMFCRLYAYRHNLVVIDDVDGLYSDRSAIRLLKSLCQTERIKSISWNSAAHQLDDREIPTQFDTASRVAIVANDWRQLNLDVAALQDRGHAVHFAPSALEVHRQAAEWFYDQEVFDFIGQRLSLVATPSFRHYVAAAELKRAGLDWRVDILARCLGGKDLAVAQLKADPKFATEAERVRAFVAAGHGCRATYFAIARRLPTLTIAPQIALQARERPTEVGEGFLDALEQSFGQLGEG